MDKVLILEERKAYHNQLIEKGVLSISADGVASNADGSNQPSKIIARLVAEKLGAKVGQKVKGQTAGTLFEQITMQFISSTFPKLQHLRPGDWTVSGGLPVRSPSVYDSQAPQIGRSAGRMQDPPEGGGQSEM